MAAGHDVTNIKLPKARQQSTLLEIPLLRLKSQEEDEGDRDGVGWGRRSEGEAAGGGGVQRGKGELLKSDAEFIEEECELGGGVLDDEGLGAASGVAAFSVEAAEEGEAGAGGLLEFGGHFDTNVVFAKSGADHLG